jgi:hypothetical protein
MGWEPAEVIALLQQATAQPVLGPVIEGEVIETTLVAAHIGPDAVECAGPVAEGTDTR